MTVYTLLDFYLLTKVVFNLCVIFNKNNFCLQTLLCIIFRHSSPKTLNPHMPMISIKTNSLCVFHYKHSYYSFLKGAVSAQPLAVAVLDQRTLAVRLVIRVIQEKKSLVLL